MTQKRPNMQKKAPAMLNYSLGSNAELSAALMQAELQIAELKREKEALRLTNTHLMSMVNRQAAELHSAQTALATVVTAIGIIPLDPANYPAPNVVRAFAQVGKMLHEQILADARKPKAGEAGEHASASE